MEKCVLLINLLFLCLVLGLFSYSIIEFVLFVWNYRIVFAYNGNILIFMVMFAAYRCPKCVELKLPREGAAFWFVL